MILMVRTVKLKKLLNGLFRQFSQKWCWLVSLKFSIDSASHNVIDGNYKRIDTLFHLNFFIILYRGAWYYCLRIDVHSVCGTDSEVLSCLL